MNEIRELLEYDAWATGQILEAVTTLGSAVPGSAASWTRDLNGPLTSLRQQLVKFSGLKPGAFIRHSDSGGGSRSVSSSGGFCWFCI